MSHSDNLVSSSTFTFVSFCICCICLILFSYQKAFAQNFEKDIVAGPVGYCGGNDVRQTSDGNFVFAGFTKNVGSGGEIYLIKTDGFGDTLWTLYCGNSNEDEARNVIQTPDNGIVASGFTTVSGGAGGIDAMLLKTDENGIPLWRKTYGGAGTEWSDGIALTNDGGFAMIGTTESFGVGMHDILLIRTDSSGNLLWAKTYGGINEEYGRSIRLTPDQGFIVCGYTNTFGAGLWDLFVMKLNSQGQISWSKTFGGTGNDYGNSIQNTADGGFIAAGNSMSFGGGQPDGYLVKLNGTGNMEWSRVIGNPGLDSFSKVIQTSDGNYIASGNSYTPALSAVNGWLVRFDDTGDTLWTRLLACNSITSIWQNGDGGFVGTGNATFSSGLGTFYMMRTDPSGNTTCIPGFRITSVSSPLTQVSLVATIVNTITLTTTSSLLSITGHSGTQATACFSLSMPESISPDNLSNLFPNPSNDVVTVQFLKNDMFDIAVYDIAGKRTAHFISKNQDQLTFYVGDFQPGSYYVKITGSEGTEIRKLIVI